MSQLSIGDDTVGCIFTKGEAFACLGMNACMPVIANASPLHRAAKQCYYWNFSKN
ncbi:MAG: hypothetical protein NUV76_03865 [Candidatus Kuenenia sp.]|nr:hypothetical protein [Candidatus Kuenenia sp.]